MTPRLLTLGSVCRHIARVQTRWRVQRHACLRTGCSVFRHLVSSDTDRCLQTPGVYGHVSGVCRHPYVSADIDSCLRRHTFVSEDTSPLVSEDTLPVSADASRVCRLQTRAACLSTCPVGDTSGCLQTPGVCRRARVSKDGGSAPLML